MSMPFRDLDILVMPGGGIRVHHEQARPGPKRCTRMSGVDSFIREFKGLSWFLPAHKRRAEIDIQAQQNNFRMIGVLRFI